MPNITVNSDIARQFQQYIFLEQILLRRLALNIAPEQIIFECSYAQQVVALNFQGFLDSVMQPRQRQVGFNPNNITLDCITVRYRDNYETIYTFDIPLDLNLHQMLINLIQINFEQLQYERDVERNNFNNLPFKHIVNIRKHK